MCIWNIGLTLFSVTKKCFFFWLDHLWLYVGKWFTFREIIAGINKFLNKLIFVYLKCFWKHLSKHIQRVFEHFSNMLKTSSFFAAPHPSISSLFKCISQWTGKTSFIFTACTTNYNFCVISSDHIHNLLAQVAESEWVLSSLPPKSIVVLTVYRRSDVV